MNRKLADKAAALVAQEKGTVFKDPGGKINIALVYPNTYSVGMSSLGFQGIYGLLNSFDDVVCERVFSPAEDELKEYERTSTEPFTLESRRALSRFDIIAFSVSFENDYPNIVKLLDMSSIPARSSARNRSHPLVIMGGVCAFYNPEPLAEFFDLCFIGEAEEMLPEFLDRYRKSVSRDELLSEVLGIEGIYVPSYYSVGYSGEHGRIISRKARNGAPEIIKKRTVPDISAAPLRPLITTPEAEFSNMILIEAMRGCIWSCRFCVAGHIYKPVREKTLLVLAGEISEARDRTGRVGLIGPSLSDYPHAEEVLQMEGVDFSITSLRANTRSAKIISLMQGHRSVSIAPEAGTERLRKVIDKRITEEGILKTSEMILNGKVETLRLYFMIGLPTETREDIEGIIGLVKKIRSQVKKGFITLSVSTFVPKPFTPFQWHPMEQLKEVKERLRMIKKGLAKVKGVKVFHDVTKFAYLQGLFSVGDRRVSGFIEDIARGKDLSWGPNIPDNIRTYYLFRNKEYDEIFPWDFIETGVPREKLRDEYMKASGV